MVRVGLILSVSHGYPWYCTNSIDFRIKIIWNLFLLEKRQSITSSQTDVFDWTTWLTFTSQWTTNNSLQAIARTKDDFEQTIIPDDAQRWWYLTIVFTMLLLLRCWWSYLSNSFICRLILHSYVTWFSFICLSDDFLSFVHHLILHLSVNWLSFIHVPLDSSSFVYQLILFHLSVIWFFFIGLLLDYGK